MHRRVGVEAAGTGSLLRKLPETNTHGWEDLGIIRKPAQVSSTRFSAGSVVVALVFFRAAWSMQGSRAQNPWPQQSAKAPTSSCRWRNICAFSPQGRLCRRDEKADSTLLDLPAASSLLQEDCRLWGCQAVNFHLV